jgi:50S ribosomal subunit-associated GTPase HflX
MQSVNTTVSHALNFIDTDLVEQITQANIEREAYQVGQGKALEVASPVQMMEARLRAEVSLPLISH